MKIVQLMVSHHISGVILYFIVLFANIDYSGVVDYALKAFIGGLIWFAFKLLGEHLLIKLKEEQKNKHEKNEES